MERRWGPCPLVEDLVTALKVPTETAPPPYVPPPGGALAPTDRFYIERSCDAPMVAAITHGEFLIRVKGPRQVGKSTALSRGIAEANKLSIRAVRLDFQRFNQEQLADLPRLYRSVLEWFIRELGLDRAIIESWDVALSPNDNFESILQEKILASVKTHLIWAMDEVDRLFSFSHSCEFFGLIRAWFNDHRSNPDGRWKNLTILISYASEAHQAITSLDQSPFNVGTELILEDFTLAQVNHLHELYGAPLGGWKEVEEFYNLIAGHPYLSQRGLYEVQQGRSTFALLKKRAALEDGPFGDHLRRILVSLARNKELLEAVRNLIAIDSEPAADPAKKSTANQLDRRTLSESELFRLRRAGILVGQNPALARLRCPVYRDYLHHTLFES